MPTVNWSIHAASAKVLDRQMRNWEHARQLRLGTPGDKRSEVEEFIYLSREVGAGGREVASELGRRLDWLVFDQELLHAMADDDEVRERLYKAMDERDLTWFEQVLHGFSDPAASRNDYFHRLTHTVLSLARQAHGIFLGRGVGLMLPRSIGTRVRIIAPPAQRLANFMRVSKLPAEEAREEMDRLDRQRGDFVWTHFHKNVEDPLLYDLTINMAELTPTDAARMILARRP